MKHRGIYVRWVDSTCNSGWHQADADSSLNEIHSIAVLVSEHPDYIVISTSKGSEDNPTYSDPLSIPRGAIRKMKRFVIEI